MLSGALCRVLGTAVDCSAFPRSINRHNPAILLHAAPCRLEKILVNTYYVQVAVRERMENGPMGPHFDLVAGELERRGYSRDGIRRRLHAADAFGQWLLGEGLSLADVTDSVVKQYVADIPRPKGLRAHTGRGVHCVMELLRKHGVIPPPLPKVRVPENAIDAFLTELERHMEEVGGLAAGTRAKHLLYERAFLKAVFPNGILDWSLLRPQHVIDFVRDRAEKLAPPSRKNPIGGIRVLVRFLVQKGQLPDGFQGATPPVRQWQHATLPRHISNDEVERVLALSTGTSPKGRRDRAMLLLLARLGLRPGEVTRLCLEDIDW